MQRDCKLAAQSTLHLQLQRQQRRRPESNFQKSFLKMKTLREDVSVQLLHEVLQVLQWWRRQGHQLNRGPPHAVGRRLAELRARGGPAERFLPDYRGQLLHDIGFKAVPLETNRERRTRGSPHLWRSFSAVPNTFPRNLKAALQSF